MQDKSDSSSLFCLGVLLFALVTPEQIQKMVVDLGDSAHAKRELAQKQLLELGEKVEPFLKEAVKSADPEISTRARQILAKVGAGDIEKPDPAILAEVAALLGPVQGSSHANLDIIVQMGKRATPSLVAIANTSDSNRRIYAMIALTRAADPRCFPALAEMFDFADLSPHMSGYVAQIKDTKILLELIKRWQKLDAKAPDCLRKQVKTMSRQDFGDDPAAYRKWYDENNASVK